MQVFSSPSHTPLLAFNSVGCIFLSSLRHFKPLKPPPFPLGAKTEESTPLSDADMVDESGDPYHLETTNRLKDLQKDTPVGSVSGTDTTLVEPSLGTGEE